MAEFYKPTDEFGNAPCNPDPNIPKPETIDYEGPTFVEIYNQLSKLADKLRRCGDKDEAKILNKILQKALISANWMVQTHDDHLSANELHKIFSPDKGYSFVHNIPVGGIDGLSLDPSLDYTEVPYVVFDRQTAKLLPNHENMVAVYSRIKNYPVK